MNVSTTNKINIYKGAKLTDTFGVLKIEASGSTGELYNYAYVYNEGVGDAPDAEAKQKVKVESDVNIGKSADTGVSDPAQISGREVNIRSTLNVVNATSETYSRAKGLGVDVTSVSKVDSDFDNIITIGSAKVTGHDLLRIVADGNPVWRTYNIETDAFSYAQGIGHARLER